MTDVYQRDPDRVLVRTTTGSVQGWRPDDDRAVAVVASFDTTLHGGKPGHAGYSQYMTVADARSLAEALLQAADHVDALTAA